MKTALISIIVPVYNIEKYLPATIDSILNQDYRNIELILVNDGSKDNSLAICNEYAVKDSRVRVLDQPNGGVSKATYAGYKAAKGEYICFSDHDDIFLPGFLSDMMEKFTEDLDMVCSSRIDLYDEEIPCYKWQGNEVFTKVTGRQAVENIIKPVPYNLALPLWGRVYRKSLLDSVDIAHYEELLPTIFMVDVFVMPFILFACKNVLYTNRVYYIHREVKTSISRSGKLNSFYFEMIKSFPVLLDFYKKNGLEEMYKDTLVSYAKSTLQRLYYKITFDDAKYPDSAQLKKDIKLNFKCIYPELMLCPMSKVDKISFRVFKCAPWFWNITIGNIYFNFLRKIKYGKAK